MDYTIVHKLAWRRTRLLENTVFWCQRMDNSEVGFNLVVDNR